MKHGFRPSFIQSNSLFCSFLILFGSVSLSRGEIPTVHLFGVFCDAYPGDAGAINTSVTQDAGTVDLIFDEILLPQSWEVNFRKKFVKGDEANKANILAQFEEFTRDIGSDDTIYIHFSGHGEIPDASKNEQHLIACDLETFSREAWAEQINNLPCRLKILITDCCSTYPPGQVAEGDQRVDPWNHFYYLLMRHHGFVNITAASPGQPAYGKANGGFLTLNLDSDVQRFPTWKEVFQSTQHRVLEETAEAPEGPQKPLAYSLATSNIILGPGESLPSGLQYIIEDSDRRIITQSELNDMSDAQIYLARNEIFARHGYDFGGSHLKHYFENRSWYQRIPNLKDPSLTAVEKRNVDTIVENENGRGGAYITETAMPDEAEAGGDNANDLFPNSSRQLLTRSAIQDLSRQELSLARNEIFARHGFPFRSQALQNYFAKKAYYTRNPNATDPPLNSIEKQNLWLIEKLERIKGGAYKW